MLWYNDFVKSMKFNPFKKLVTTAAVLGVLSTASAAEKPVGKSLPGSKAPIGNIDHKNKKLPEHYIVPGNAVVIAFSPEKPYKVKNKEYPYSLFIPISQFNFVDGQLLEVDSESFNYTHHHKVSYPASDVIGLEYFFQTKEEAELCGDSYKREFASSGMIARTVFKNDVIAGREIKKIHSAPVKHDAESKPVKVRNPENEGFRIEPVYADPSSSKGAGHVIGHNKVTYDKNTGEVIEKTLLEN